MKTIYTFSILLGITLFLASTDVKAQNGNCVQCNGSSATGANASAIGNNTTASGNNSFAGGYNSQATGSNSFAFGYNSKSTQSTTAAIGNTALASGIGSVAIGNYVKATAQYSYVFGSGTSASYPLTNATAYSIAFGVNSNKPTLLITKSLNNNYTGKVAIGSITNPQAKLHIKSDSNEDAGVFLEPSNKTQRKAFINLFDSNHNIMVDQSAAMQFNAGDGSLIFSGEHVCIGRKDETKIRLYTGGTPALYYNVRREKDDELREGEHSSYAIQFNDDAIQFRTASYQLPREGINNWRTAMYITTNGRIGIGSMSTFLENTSSDNLIAHSPGQIHLESPNIKLTGKIGINTDNTVDDYALAVDGGIISSKVFIKEVKHWPDHVFADNYTLMGWDELRQYLDENRHLPGVPAESDIVSNGYDIHEMQYVLLEKIEEMTRYILLLQDEISELKSANDTGIVQFTYDENGNRIYRGLLFQQITDKGLAPTLPQDLPYDLFPNPTHGQFTLLLKASANGTRLHARLTTTTGVVLEEKDIQNGRADFDLSRQAEGMYILEIEGNEGIQAWKVIKRQ